MKKDFVRFSLGTATYNKDCGTKVINITNVEDAHSSLKDIAVLLYKCCGHGVMWNLAHEIAKETNGNYDEIALAIDKIVDKYYKMSDEEALDMFLDTPSPSDEYFDKMK